MNRKEIAALTDQELLAKAKKMKSAAIVNALFIGCMIGIIVYSIYKSSVGLFTLIPLFFAYKLVKNARNTKDVEEELKARNLK